MTWRSIKIKKIKNHRKSRRNNPQIVRRFKDHLNINNYIYTRSSYSIVSIQPHSRQSIPNSIPLTITTILLTLPHPNFFLSYPLPNPAPNSRFPRGTIAPPPCSNQDSSSGSLAAVKFALPFHANPINLSFRSNCAAAQDIRYSRVATPEVGSLGILPANSCLGLMDGARQLSDSHAISPFSNCVLHR